MIDNDALVLSLGERGKSKSDCCGEVENGLRASLASRSANLSWMGALFSSLSEAGFLPPRFS